MSRRRLPSPAMVIACIALIAAIGGSAYAASKINGKNIKNNTVTGKQIKEKTVKNVKSAKKAKKAKKANRAKVANRAKTADSAKTADTATTVAGQSPTDLKSRWFLLDERGRIVDQSGGFTVIDAYDTNTNAYIDSGSSLLGKGFSATIGIQNQIAGGNTSGEVSVSRCQIAGSVECAPPGAKNVNSLVVSPRNSDGTPAATVSPGTGVPARRRSAST